MKKLRRLLTILFAITLVLINMKGYEIVKAETDAIGINLAGKVEDINGVPGETVRVKIPVMAVGDYIQDPKIIVKTEGMPYQVYGITYTQGGIDVPLGISNNVVTNIEFNLKVKDNAKMGRYKIEILVEYYDSVNYKTKEVAVPTTYVVVEKEKEPAQLTVDKVLIEEAIRGNDTYLSFVIKNEGGISAHSTYFTVEGYADNGIIPKYTKETQLIGTDGVLAPGASYQARLPVSIAPNAKTGTYVLTVKTTYKDPDGEAASNTAKLYVNIEDNVLAPAIEVESTKYPSELKVGDSFNFVATIRNKGVALANSIEVTVDGLEATSFLPNYINEVLTVGDLAMDDKLDVKIPLIVSKQATIGIKKLDIKIKYKDNGGVEYTTTTSAYLEVTSAEGVTAEGKLDIVISKVSQSPNIPNAGGRVDISFDLENRSNVGIRDIKVSVTNLSATTFSPINSEPYQYIDTLSGGKKTRVTIPLELSPDIPQGMNSINVKYEYKDGSGNVQSDTTTLYMLDVENTLGSSKPRLMINNFSTDIEELRAGSIFNFTFDIKNTHSSISAKNIKITVSQTENIYSVTKGSNTLYVTSIPAGEVVQNSLELKVKADAVTKAYPLDIKIEYEYDGAEANPATGEVGSTVTETINLQAIENSRPVVDNVSVGGWDVPIVNQPTMLTFEFYNMGKSTLNNVYAKVEGDFYRSTGSMYYIGNVLSGQPEFAELEVIPTVEGLAKGTLIITFEDSNGDEVSVTKEFEANVQGEYIPEPGDWGNNGGMIPEVPEAKKEILSGWLFIVIQVALLGIGILVSRKITLALHRRKLKKQEELE